MPFGQTEILMPNVQYKIKPIGIVQKQDEQVFIEIYPEYMDGLLGIDQFSHINVFYWFSENDDPESRSLLQVYPCGNEVNPLTGVFATHSPRRPNLIAYTTCKILSVEDNGIKIDDIDAFDGSPVIDIKSYFPDDIPPEQVRAPDWEGHPEDEDEE